MSDPNTVFPQSSASLPTSQDHNGLLPHDGDAVGPQQLPSTSGTKGDSAELLAIPIEAALPEGTVVGPLEAVAIPSSELRGAGGGSSDSDAQATDGLIGQPSANALVGQTAPLSKTQKPPTPPAQGINVDLLFNGDDADRSRKAPEFAVGETIDWTFQVTNTGRTPYNFNQVRITNSQLDSKPQFDPSSDEKGDRILSPGEQWIYRATTIAEELSVILDFETDGKGNDLTTGQTIDNEFKNLGLRVSTPRNRFGAMIFDTANPSRWDQDLGTPNVTFGGPGIGKQGEQGQPGENGVALDNVLIISQDGRSRVPNDNRWGGTLRFNWDAPVELNYADFLDLQTGKKKTTSLLFYNWAKQVVDQETVIGLGNNAYQRVQLDRKNVFRFDINLKREGALTELSFERMFKNVTRVTAGKAKDRDVSFYRNGEDKPERPLVQAELANDTGLSESDGISFDATIAGTVTGDAPIASLRAGLGDTSEVEFVDVSAALNADGSFSLSPEALATVNGGALPDGAYTLNLQAVDDQGNPSDIFGLSFLLDTVLSPLTLDLAEASDSGDQGDQQTTFETVTLDGESEPNVQVALQGTTLTVNADNDGAFAFSDIALAEGDNPFTISATDVAGNVAETTIIIERIGVNQAPIVDADKALTVDEDSAPTALGISAPIDPDGDSLTITVDSLPTATKGTVQLADGSSVTTGQVLSLDELDALVFVPEADENGEAGVFSYSVDDGQGGRATQAITLAITPVNDAPSLTVPGAQETLDNENLTITGIRIADVDVADGDLEVTLAVNNGVLDLAQTTGLTFNSGNGTADATMVFTGTLAAINTALASVSYSSDADFDGQDSLRVSVSDLGNTGTGGALTDSQVIPITVISSGNTVSGTVFIDENGNAERDGTESGQSGVTVFLDLNSNGFLNPGEPSQVTGNNGQYRFDDAPSGSYLVWEQVPDSFEQTAPESFFATVNLEGGTTVENVDFGNQEFIFPTGTGEITGFKWEDINANGVRDTELVQGSNPDIVFVIDVSGSADFNFVGSDIGDFNGDGRTNTRLDAEIAGFIALNDQLVAQGLGESAEVGIVVFSGNAAQADMNTTADGVQLLATPTADEDGNGVADVEDILRSLRSGAFGVGNNTGTNFEVALRDVENTFTTVGTEVGSGNVVFLSDGEVNRGGSVSDEIARLDALGVNISAFGVGSDASLPDLRNVDPDAEIFTTAEELIGVFSNLDAGEDIFVEPTIEGFTVFLDLNEDGQLDQNEPTQVTDADGNYRFTGLAAGTYQVREIQQSGFGQTFPFAQEVTAADGSTVIVPGFHTVTVVEGQVSDGFNFGNKKNTGEIRGVKWEDLNGDGVFDDDEATLEGVTVYLDLNQNGRIDINEPSQQTDENGRYRFRDLDAGNYIVREVVPFEFAQTAPTAFYDVDLGIGEVVEDLNFGNQFVGFNTPPDIISIPVIEYTIPPAPVETIEFVDFSDLSTIQLGGDAANLTPVADRNILRLVDSARPFESGNALIQNPFNLFGPGNAPLSFSTNFQFQITDPGGITDEDGAGADGIAFVLTPTANLGGAGIGIGYQGLQNTVAIEFDTYNNGAIDDNNGNHVGLALNGNNNAIAQTAVTPRFNNGEVWNAWIEYDGVSQQIEVWASLSTDRPDAPLLSEAVDIPSIVGSDEFFIGFTSATGAAFGVHDILSWNFATGQFLEELDDYAYQVIATDEESDPLTYSLTEAPTGAVIDATTGELSWDSSFITPGSYDFTVQVDDGRGGTDDQSYVLEVVEGIPDAAPNQAPTIVTDPTFNVAPGNLYLYNVNAIDPENTTITYSLDAAAPEGMEIAPDTGVIRWTPTASQLGEFPITVTATDADGAFATQTFTITVDQAFVDLPNPELPTVELGFSSNIVAIGEELNLQVRGTDAEGLANLELTANGTAVALDNEIRSGAINTATLQFSQAGLVDLVATATDTDTNIDTETLTIRVVDPTDTTGPLTELDLAQFEGSGSVITAPIDIIGTVNDDSLEFYRLEIAPVDLVNPNNPTAPNDAYRVLAEGTGSVDGVLGQVDPTLLANGNYFLRVITGDFSGNVSADGTTISIAGDLKPGRFTQEFVDLSIPVAGLPIEVTRVYDSLEANRNGDFGFGWSLGEQDAQIQESVPVTDFDGFGLFTATSFSVGDTVTLTNPDGERVTFTFDPVVTSSVPFLGPIWSPRFVPEDGVFDTLEVDNASLTVRPDGTVSTFFFPFPYNPSEYRLTTRDGTTYQYDQFDGLEGVTDRNGNTLTYTDNGIFSSTGESVQFLRDGQGRITEIVDPAGNAIEYGYDASGDLVTITDREDNVTELVYEEPQLPHYLSDIIDPLGRGGVRNEYDDQGRLVRLIDADGNALDVAFNGTNSQTVTDPLGNTTTFIFDDRGNVVQQVDAEGGITLSIYDEDDNLTSTTDPLGNTTTFTYDDQGNLLTETDALGNTTNFTYNQFSQVLTTVDALGFTTTNEYDADGNLTQTTDAEGNTVTSEYDNQGNPVQVTDESGNVTTLEYNAFGLITQVTDPEGGVGTVDYDSRGNVTSATTPRGLTSTFGYDNENRLTIATDPLGNVSTFEYDAAGQRTAIIDSLGRRTEFTYNDRGLLETTTFPDGTVETLVYDALDRQIATIDRNGNRTEFQYDALDRLIGVLDALNNQTTYGLDLNGNILEQIDAEGRTTTFTYDALDQVVTTTLPLGQAFTNSYDVVGNLIQTNDFNGDILNYDYDGLGQLSAISLADGTALEAFTYTPTGQIATTQDERGLTAFTYDGLDRLASRIDPDGTEISYLYDADGNVASLTTPAGTVQYTYDALNLLDTVTDREGGVTDYDYDEVGNLIQTTFANGVVEIRDYDVNDRVEELATVDGNGNVLASYTYTFDNVGNRLSEIDNTGRVTEYEYDNLYRVTEAEVTDATLGNETTTYTYDNAGNILTKTDSDGTTTYTYDDNDRLIQEEIDGQTTTYTYDEAGNRLDKRINGIIVDVYNWNIQGELAGATINDGGTTTNVSYQYNTDGMRVSQTVNGEETRFLIDANQQEFAQVIEEYSPGGIIQAVYTHGNDLISQRRETEKGFYHTGSLGSVRLLTDASGNVANTYTYAPYGSVTNQSELQQNSYRFTGEQLDPELDNYYLRARYYNPATGRFVSRDPFEGILRRPLSLNDYLYTEGNPINAIDPTGEVSTVAYLILAGGLVGAAIAVVDTVACGELVSGQAPSTEDLITAGLIGAAIGIANVLVGLIPGLGFSAVSAGSLRRGAAVGAGAAGLCGIASFA